MTTNKPPLPIPELAERIKAAKKAKAAKLDPVGIRLAKLEDEVRLLKNRVGYVELRCRP